MMNSIAVACYELYGSDAVNLFKTNLPCQYSDFWLDNVMCTGTETEIRNCPHTGYGNHDCNPAFECVAVFC